MLRIGKLSMNGIAIFEVLKPFALSLSKGEQLSLNSKKLNSYRIDDGIRLTTNGTKVVKIRTAPLKT